ncbi:hypothetical protein T492DRAFT_892883 [Pavlovales sp. CCMP2436]|nr:hypothetical protein T492DRAFT_892883 [Pavlovales sp. CCMP2436]
MLKRIAEQPDLTGYCAFHCVEIATEPIERAWRAGAATYRTIHGDEYQYNTQLHHPSFAWALEHIPADGAAQTAPQALVTPAMELNQYFPELLNMVSSAGDVGTVRSLLEASADVQYANTGADMSHAGVDGLTALTDANTMGHTDCVCLLLAAGADINYATASGITALVATSLGNHAECACLLLEAGADVLARNSGGAAALYLGSARLAVVQLLCAYGAKREPLHPEAPADVRAWVLETSRWNTPLHYLELNPPSRVRQLLVGGTDVHASNSSGDSAPTPFGLARALLVRDPAHEGASLMVAAAAPWSRKNHALFPAHVRARAAELLRLDQLLVREARFAGNEVALLDGAPAGLGGERWRVQTDESRLAPLGVPPASLLALGWEWNECRNVMPESDTHFKVGCTAACVTADTNKADRRRVFEAFQSPNTTSESMLFFLFSVRILSEGIDLPLTDTVMWLDGPSRTDVAKVRFVQELCRALRFVEGKDYALCIVWASVLDMDLMDAIGRLHEEDPHLNSRISISDGAYDKQLTVPGAERAKVVEGLATSVDDFIKRFTLVPVELDQVWVQFKSAITVFNKTHRIAFLNSIGFEWNVRDTKYEMFKLHFKTFYDREHHGEVPRGHKEIVGAKEYNLGRKCADVRSKENMLKGHPDEAARREELISIGFVFDPSEPRFNLLVKALETYQRLDGNARRWQRAPTRAVSRLETVDLNDSGGLLVSGANVRRAVITTDDIVEGAYRYYSTILALEDVRSNVDVRELRDAGNFRLTKANINANNIDTADLIEAPDDVVEGVGAPYMTRLRVAALRVPSVLDHPIGMAMYGAVRGMPELFKALQAHSHMVILTARPAGSEAHVVRNCEAIGLTLRPIDKVATCPASRKAAWRTVYCERMKLIPIVVAGDLVTDVNGPAGAVAMHLQPDEAFDVGHVLPIDSA